jgi:enediyne biosynthesis protein E4
MALNGEPATGQPFSHRRRWIVGGFVAVVIVVVVGLVGFGLVWPGRGASSVALPPPRFVDETAAAGVDQTYDGSSTFAVGGGVAVFDCNSDGKPDLYLSGGAQPAALYRNDGPVGGGLRFSRMSDHVTDLSRVTGAYPLDIDGDGQVDLAVLRIGENVLLRGLGDCRFERANERLAFDGGDSMTTAFSATWEGPTVLPTLAIGNYLQLDGAGESTTDCAENALITPTVAGTAYAPPIALAPGYCALSMLFSDWNRSGRRDLRVSNDRHYYDNTIGEEQLWHVAPGEAPRLYAVADGWAQVQIEGMGIASYDVTGDTYPDVFLTSQGANRLQALTNGPSKPTYGDIGLKRGVNATRPYAGGDDLPSTAWHPEFADVNNDGLIDLFISKGNVEEQPDYAHKDPPNLLIGQADGAFKEGGLDAGIVGFARGRGAALVDFNLDGLLDLVEVDYGTAAKVWRNVGSGDLTTPARMGNWLALEVLDPERNNRNAVGAWIEVKVGDRTMTRELTVGGGHAGGQLGWVHFGIGQADGADVRVQWPDGELGPWLRVPANQFSLVNRGAFAALPWVPPAN